MYFWTKDIYTKQIQTDLLHNINIVSLQIDNFDDVDDIAKKTKKVIGLRVTIIDENGVVIGESDKKLDTMDNHANRNEIVQAKYQEYGQIVRYSNTLDKELLYVAKQFALDKHHFIIRMARDIDEINKEFYTLSFKIALLFIAFLLIGFSFTLTLSREVESETNNILDFLHGLKKQNKASKINSTYSYEFNMITTLLTSVSNSLAKKDKQKQKYTAKLKISNRQKDDIISAISHEFKNPIAVISGYTQTLQDDKDINPNIRDKFLDKISINAQKLTNMIDRLRLSIKLEEGNQAYKFSSCNISSLIENTIEELKDAYPQRNINFIPSDVRVEIDETIFSIAVINLIENALKYSQDDVTVKLTNSYISVIDGGIGLSQKDIPNITNKFYRVSTNGWNNSLGVGLSLVVSILKIHKFKLDIQSVENKGSSFHIIF